MNTNYNLPTLFSAPYEQPLERKSASLSSSFLKSEESRDSVKYLESQDSSNKTEIWNLNYCL